MNILGLYDGHNCNAALVSDGEIAAAVEEERFSRIKNHDGRLAENDGPVQSVKYCLSQLKGRLDAVAVALEAPGLLQRRALRSYFNSGNQDYLNRLLVQDIRGQKMTGRDLIEYPLIAQQMRLNKINDVLKAAGLDLYKVKITYINHHLAHLASAYWTQPEDDVLLFSLDGKGDGLAGMVGIGQNNKIKVLDEIDYIHSLGHFYSAVTVVCGFSAIKHEGKITGLAAYAEPDPRLLSAFRKLFTIVEGQWRSSLNSGLKLGPYPHTLFGELIERIGRIVKGYSRETIASTAQRFTEEIVVQWVRYWIEKTGVKNIALAGGVFANVKVNQRIAEIEKVTSVYVHPAMADSGLGLGAALLTAAADGDYQRQSLNHIYLGPAYCDKEIESLLKQEGLNYTKPDDIELRIAQLLAESRIVARFAGRLEYGPRALGNRSILYNTRDASVNDWLNKRLQRTEFMPFAPLTLQEDTKNCYFNCDSTKYTAQFMTITYQCTPYMCERHPAVVHLDGTARPQIVSLGRSLQEDALFRLMKHYQSITGRTSLLNTSFNVHEEPIVCSPADALKAFRQCRLDYLAIGSFLVCLDDNLPPRK